MNESSDSGWDELRLRSLHALGTLDAPAEPALDRICRLVERVFHCDTVVVSLVDRNRQWFKRRSGIVAVDETPRDWAVCDYTIRQQDVFEVPDLRADPRFAENPLVTAEPGLVYYAGAPVVLNDGTIPGSLCLMDDKSRAVLSLDERKMLLEFAKVVARELEVHKTLMEALAVIAQPG